MNTQNVWIKRSEREPGNFDWPLFAGYYEATLGWTELVVHREGPIGNATHWRSIKCDPPPRELTQRERDEETIGNIVVSYRYSGPTRQVAEAIYAERREVAKLMDEIMRNSTWGTSNAWEPYHRQLRARLDEQGAK